MTTDPGREVPAADPGRGPSADDPDHVVPAAEPSTGAAGPSDRGLVRRLWWIPGIALVVLVVIVLAPLASGDPDGLEWVAGEHGFIANAQDALYSIFPDYTIPGIDDPNVSTVLAGLIGVVLVFLVMFGLGRLLARRRG
jgi:hypothetical protein